ncbi:hypothetical protein VTO73DRAFT_10422 [Trametes versicolor]
MSSRAPLSRLPDDIEQQGHQIAAWRMACADTNSTDNRALTGVSGTNRLSRLVRSEPYEARLMYRRIPSADARPIRQHNTLDKNLGNSRLSACLGVPNYARPSQPHNDEAVDSNVHASGCMHSSRHGAMRIQTLSTTVYVAGKRPSTLRQYRPPHTCAFNDIMVF